MCWLYAPSLLLSRLWLLLGAPFFMTLAACSKSGGSNSGNLAYRLERSATNTTRNALLLDIQGNFSPKFSLTGTGFAAEVTFDEVNEAQPRTELTADNFGEVTVNITLYQENGQAYLNDALTWKSSPEVPPIPSPSFSENASSDAYVYLILPRNRGKNVQEVWVAGDLEDSVAEGQYYPIPSDDQVLLQLSDNDGLKHLKVRYRNIFGTESETVETSVIRKGQGPKNCKVTPIAKSTATGYLRAKIEAENVGVLYYKVIGDTTSFMDFKAFDGSIDDLIALSPGEGLKNLTFKIKDDAGNFCKDIAMKIDYNRSYISGTVAIKNGDLWTSTNQVEILAHYDHIEGDNISMWVRGDIQPSSQTFQWIPYTEELTLTLNPSSGNRHIIILFRKDSTDMAEVEVPIFLNPYLVLSGSSPQYTLVPSQIPGLVSMSITGCSQIYTNIAFANNLPCTPAAGKFQATATYYLSDGTSLSRSAGF